MVNKDYTKYSEKLDNSDIIKELEATTIEIVQPEGLVIATEPVDITLPEENIVETEMETNVESEVETIEEGNAKLTGVVSGCAKLNIRKEPNKDAEVLCVINKGEEVEFDTEEEVTYELFYKVITSTGVKGYCMKQFINIK